MCSSISYCVVVRPICAHINERKATNKTWCACIAKGCQLTSPFPSAACFGRENNGARAQWSTKVDLWPHSWPLVLFSAEIDRPVVIFCSSHEYRLQDLQKLPFVQQNWKTLWWHYEIGVRWGDLPAAFRWFISAEISGDVTRLALICNVCPSSFVMPHDGENVAVTSSNLGTLQGKQF